jgi:hypothetical protein
VVAKLFEAFGSLVLDEIDALSLTFVPGAVAPATVSTKVKLAEVLAAIEAGPLQTNCVPDEGPQVQPLGHGVVEVTVAQVNCGPEAGIQVNASVITGLTAAAGPRFLTTTV